TFTVTLPFALAERPPPRSLLRLDGVHCLVIESGDLAAADLRVYLEHAGAQVGIAGDITEAARQAAAWSLAVIVYDTGYAEPPLDELRSAFAAHPAAHFLILTRGRGRRARVEGPDVVCLDGDGLRRQALLRAVAIAAGQASPEVIPDPGDDLPDDDTVVAPGIAEARAAGRLILVAEDDEINQKVILRQLGLLGYAAELAGTGSEALRLWRQGNYAMLLTDLHMPEMDGYALAAAIRQEESGGRRMPILALTANALRGEANRARAAGMDEYLTKPIQLSQLGEALEKWLPKAAASAPAVPAPPPAASPRQVVDLAVLAGLLGHNRANLHRLLGIYQTSLRTARAEFEAARAADDIRAIAAVAHRLKSSSRSIGALALGDICAELENACRAGDAVAITEGTGKLAAALDEVDASVVDLLNTPGMALEEMHENPADRR
ncbi:MAG TPA: response regulator, partial [Azonexus sp.]